MSSHILNQNLKQNKRFLQLKIETQGFSWKELFFCREHLNRTSYVLVISTLEVLWHVLDNLEAMFLYFGRECWSKVLSCFDAIFLKPSGSQSTDLSGPSIALGTFSSFIKNKIRS